VHYGKFKFDKEEAERKKREAIEAEKNKEEWAFQLYLLTNQ
jgi:translation initiation factor IF-3